MCQCVALIREAFAYRTYQYSFDFCFRSQNNRKSSSPNNEMDVQYNISRPPHNEEQIVRAPPITKAGLVHCCCGSFIEMCNVALCMGYRAVTYTNTSSILRGGCYPICMNAWRGIIANSSVDLMCSTA